MIACRQPEPGASETAPPQRRRPRRRIRRRRAVRGALGSRPPATCSWSTRRRQHPLGARRHRGRAARRRPSTRTRRDTEARRRPPAAIPTLYAVWSKRARRGWPSWSPRARGSTATTTGACWRSREGGHYRRRVVHAGGDATGAEVCRALARPRDRPGSPDARGQVTALVLTDSGPRRVVTARSWLRPPGPSPIRARATVLATGGLGHVYPTTHQPCRRLR